MAVWIVTVVSSILPRFPRLGSKFNVEGENDNVNILSILIPMTLRNHVCFFFGGGGVKHGKTTLIPPNFLFGGGDGKTPVVFPANLPTLPSRSCPRNGAIETRLRPRNVKR